MKKRPILERVETFLAAHPFAKKIPVHPADFVTFCSKYADRVGVFKYEYLGLPVTPIGGLKYVYNLKELIDDK
jgi:hypothetical protein